jgi:hypothetical protein
MIMRKLVEVKTAKDTHIDLNHWTYVSSGRDDIFVAMFQRDHTGAIKNLYHMRVRSINEGYHLVARLWNIGPY